MNALVMAVVEKVKVVISGRNDSCKIHKEQRRQVSPVYVAENWRERADAWQLVEVQAEVVQGGG